MATHPQDLFSPRPHITVTPDVADAGLLFHVDGATEDTLQWKAESLQLVNWGGFEGRVRFDFHPGATLLSGASGTGKSTMLDGIIALLMPSDVSFNGASNDAAGGRARSAEQRNLLSYLRGQVDTTTDADGQEKPKVLRGDTTDTWGAVGMTFVDDHGRRFTAARTYYVPARAHTAADISIRMITVDGALDLADLHAHVGTTHQDHFAPERLKAAFGGLSTWKTYDSFADTLYVRLGIGANGDGAKALRLLVRIQAGHQIRTVDALYKDMVLEAPATFDAADRAIAHFDDLEVSYRAMLTEQRKADLLGPITALHDRMVAARTEIDTLDTVGLTRGGDTPLTLWTLQTEDELLTAATNTNRDARTLTSTELDTARVAVEDRERDVRAAEDDHRNSGGADLDRLADEIKLATRARDDRTARRSTILRQLAPWTPGLATRAEFDALQAQATAFLEAYPAAAAALNTERDALGARLHPLAQRSSELTADRDSFTGRQGRVPRALDGLRREVAVAAGMDPSELPFLAELIDVPTEQAPWRTAIETVLGASARLLLVPREHLEAFSAAIDPLRLRGRLTFEGVPSHLPADPDSDTDTGRVAGKLVYQDHRFQGWVARHVAEPSRNAMCVQGTTDLGGGGYRVTQAGQTRSGSRGSHGRSDTAAIIGFSSADAIADLDRQLAELAPQLAEVDSQRHQVEVRLSQLNAQQRSHLIVQAAVWDDIDVPEAQVRISTLTETRERILAADDQLRVLAERIVELTALLDTAREHQFGLRRRKDDLERAQRELVDRQDIVTAELDRFRDDQRVVLTEELADRLRDELTAAASPADPRHLPDLGTNLGRLRQRLMTILSASRSELTSASTEMTRLFTAYQEQWQDPNLGCTTDSYPDYARILGTIISTGLHTRRDEWRRRLTTWTGEHLVPLSQAMTGAVENIEDRLRPINTILATLPFGATGDRLQIQLRRLSPEHVVNFRRDLRQMSSTATKGLPDSELDRRFIELQTFIGQMRRRDDPRAEAGLADRAQLLDVRRHVEISAERRSSDGVLLSTHSSLGGKSGGESQELVAFIVGAALRFRLGDDLRARPRFAPVFLDEGFVKSDAEFAGRAVQAWKGLGFQLIVGAPLDKVTALEPHMDQLMAITKDTATGYSFVHPITRVTGAGDPVAGRAGR